MKKLHWKEDQTRAALMCMAGDRCVGRVAQNDDGGWDWATYKHGWTVDHGHERSLESARQVVMLNAHVPINPGQE